MGGYGLRLATITNPPPNLKLKIDGINEEFTVAELVISEQLLDFTTNAKIEAQSASVTGHGQISGTASFSGESGNISVDASEISITEAGITADVADLSFEMILKKGDRVVVAPVNNNVYAVLCKVVRL